jgi:hypothetical protein
MTSSRIRTVVVLALSVPLASCATASTPQQIAQRNNDRCIARGYQPGTDAFADCVVRVDNERDQRMEKNRREMLEKPDGPGLPRGY